MGSGPKIKCAECGMWFYTNKIHIVPDHKPKGDVLSIKNCVGSGKKPSQRQGLFE